jgi:hypothetical protein
LSQPYWQRFSYQNEQTYPNSGASNVQTYVICRRKKIYRDVGAAVLVRMHDRGADKPDRLGLLPVSSRQSVSCLGASVF